MFGIWPKVNDKKWIIKYRRYQLSYKHGGGGMRTYTVTKNTRKEAIAHADNLKERGVNHVWIIEEKTIKVYETNKQISKTKKKK